MSFITTPTSGDIKWKLFPLGIIFSIGLISIILNNLSLLIGVFLIISSSFSSFFAFVIFDGVLFVVLFLGDFCPVFKLSFFLKSFIKFFVKIKSFKLSNLYGLKEIILPSESKVNLFESIIFIFFF